MVKHYHFSNYCTQSTGDDTMIHKKENPLNNLVAQTLFPNREDKMDDKIKDIYERLNQIEAHVSTLEEVIRQIKSYRTVCESLKEVE